MRLGFSRNVNGGYELRQCRHSFTLIKLWPSDLLVWFCNDMLSIGDICERVAWIVLYRRLLIIHNLENTTLVKNTCLLLHITVVCIDALLFLIDLNARNLVEAVFGRKRGKWCFHASVTWLYELRLFEAFLALLSTIDFNSLSCSECSGSKISQKRPCWMYLILKGTFLELFRMKSSACFSRATVRIILGAVSFKL